MAQPGRLREHCPDGLRRLEREQFLPESFHQPKSRAYLQEPPQAEKPEAK